MKDVILYSIGCSNCEILKDRLDENGIEYTIVDDKDKMIAMGMTSMPMLDVDGHLMEFSAAMKWAKRNK